MPPEYKFAAFVVCLIIMAFLCRRVRRCRPHDWQLVRYLREDRRRFISVWCCRRCRISRVTGTRPGAPRS